MSADLSKNWIMSAQFGRHIILLQKNVVAKNITID